MIFTYVTTNLVNNKQYVGVHETLDINDNYLGSGKYLEKAIAKYGKKNFKIDVLEYCDNREKAFVKEEEYIDKLNTLYPNGYNLHPSGGINGFKDKNYFYGKKHSEESKLKMSKSHTGKIVSEETRGKIRKASLGRKHSEETKMKLRNPRGPISEEHRIKLSKSHTGIKHSEETKRKISKNNTRNMKGKNHSKESIEKMRIAKKNISDETRQKYRESHHGQIPWNKGKKLKPLSEECKKKISLSLKGKNTWSKGCKLSEECKSKIRKHLFNRPVSDETRKKISESNRITKNKGKICLHLREVKDV